MAAAKTSNPTVVYIEDEEDDAFFMRRAFEKAGLGPALRIVADGREAANYFEGKHRYGNRQEYPLPAMVLLDLNLPDISGFDLLIWLRKRQEFETLPVVIFSSSARKEDRQRAHELGASDYLEKPASLPAFGKVVETIQNKWLRR